jgi:hypothetical protein
MLNFGIQALACAGRVFVSQMRAVRASSSVPICNFHFAIFNLQYDSSQGELARQVKLLQIENCKSQIAN